MANVAYWRTGRQDNSKRLIGIFIYFFVSAILQISSSSIFGEYPCFKLNIHGRAHLVPYKSAMTVDTNTSF